MRVQDEGRSNAAHWHKVAAEQRVRAEKAEAENARLNVALTECARQHGTACQRQRAAEAENARLRAAVLADEAMAELIAAANLLELVEHGDGEEVWLLARASVQNRVGAGSIRLTGEFAKDMQRRFAIIRTAIHNAEAAIDRARTDKDQGHE